MNCNPAQSASAALPLHASAQFSATWVSAFAKIQTLWHDHAERANKARAMAVFAEIDEHTLKDIGAPNWVIAEAAHRGDSRGLRLIDLYRS